MTTTTKNSITSLTIKETYRQTQEVRELRTPPQGERD